jgi:glycosyltransferase involved in cell wall biosynthesis
VGANEVSDFRDYGLRSPVAVIPNGISQDWLDSRGSSEAFRRQFGIPAEKRILLFLSRVTPKKGLLMLLEAVRLIERDFADWQLVIAGPDEFNHRSEVESFIEQKGLAKQVRLVGPLFDQVKRDAFAAAEIFILPSFSEGAPVVILEALGCEVPVLTTKASPWPELETHGCGWWIDIGTGPLTEALTDALRRSPENLQKMGRQGRDLVFSGYSWTKSARMTIELYEWLLGQRERPEFVVTG